MLEDITQIQSTISEIQSTIASLTPTPAVPAGPPAQQTFTQALAAAQAPDAQAAETSAESASEPSSAVSVPPASLGPLPPLPVTPAAGEVSPLPATTTDVSDFDDLIQTSADQSGVDPSLVRAVIQTESGGNPRAVSKAGAVGLMQLMPENVKAAGVSDPFDPAQNIAAGTRQLASLLKQYHGNQTLALAAYNAGSGNVEKYGGVPPFPETQAYVRKVRAAMEKG